jgi:hypothetical protein
MCNVYDVNLLNGTQWSLQWSHIPSGALCIKRRSADVGSVLSFIYFNIFYILDQHSYTVLQLNLFILTYFYFLFLVSSKGLDLELCLGANNRLQMYKSWKEWAESGLMGLTCYSYIGTAQAKAFQLE